ncbi:hypothetical protein [Oceanirhabdus sp. W0125-5]|uniref:hypothetical protein n=1 Tax=Oceanirhabdus sp. W0125-5 TaxID=2999116 RepID=UPI0022F2D1E9|nr:hypothetical protein [Oceanirhabdus sp. W0125-5]WBW96626.1 hypothetical protein OW730_23475 [Oceanirhabdus sp. W0125-5]
MTTLQTSKEIKDIFAAMDKLTMSELAMGHLDPGCCPNENECLCDIPFCSTITLPVGFDYMEDIGDTAKFAITKCCIRKVKGYCEVDTLTQICNMPVTVSTKVLVEKVFGTIHFMVAVDGIIGDCGVTLTNDGFGNWTPMPGPLTALDNKTTACCIGNLCIDRIVNVVDMADANTCPLWDTDAELTCENFELIDFEVISGDCDPATPTPTPTPTPTATPQYACNHNITIKGKLKLVGLPDCCP